MALMEVRYRGLSDYRILTAKDLENYNGISIGQHTGVPKGIADRINRDLVGVDVNPQKDLVWGRHNNFKLIIDVDENMERVLRDEGHFSLAAVTDDGGVMPIAEAVTSEDNPSEIIANEAGKAQQRNEVAPRQNDGAEDVDLGSGSTEGTSKATTTGGSTSTKGGRGTRGGSTRSS